MGQFFSKTEFCKTHTLPREQGKGVAQATRTFFASEADSKSIECRKKCIGGWQ